MRNSNEIVSISWKKEIDFRNNKTTSFPIRNTHTQKKRETANLSHNNMKLIGILFKMVHFAFQMNTKKKNAVD